MITRTGSSGIDQLRRRALRFFYLDRNALSQDLSRQMLGRTWLWIRVEFIINGENNGNRRARL